MGTMARLVWVAKGEEAGLKRINRMMQRLMSPAPIRIHCFLEPLPLFLFGCGYFKMGDPSDPFNRSCCAFLRASMIRLILKPPGKPFLNPLQVHFLQNPGPVPYPLGGVKQIEDGFWKSENRFMEIYPK